MWFSPVVPNLGVETPTKGHKVHLRGWEMINEWGKIRKQRQPTQICIHALHALNFSQMFCFIVNNVIIFSIWDSNYFKFKEAHNTFFG